ncbi:MAG: PilZ domain-containing protein [Rhodospirillales bacterium]|nr:PilZ domain-containing protein [Rhodospirillales bacterium]
MSDNKRRHQRVALNEPASVATGTAIFDGTVIDVSESGAAVEFNFGSGESRIKFDIGSDVEVDSEHVAKRQGRVVRYYDKGFAVNFEDEG